MEDDKENISQAFCKFSERDGNILVFCHLTISPRRGGGGGYATPFSDFPSCRFLFFVKITIWSIYLLFVHIPIETYEFTKINSKNSNLK